MGVWDSTPPLYREAQQNQNYAQQTRLRFGFDILLWNELKDLDGGKEPLPTPVGKAIKKKLICLEQATQVEEEIRIIRQTKTRDNGI